MRTEKRKVDQEHFARRWVHQSSMLPDLDLDRNLSPNPGPFPTLLLHFAWIIPKVSSRRYRSGDRDHAS